MQEVLISNDIITEENIPGKTKKGIAALSTEGLTVTFDSRPAISDVNISFLKNKVTSIIGPSGCGKSTLLRSFNYMHDLIPKSEVTGKIFVLGKDINEYDSVGLRKKVGMVFQKPNPFPTLSVFENVVAGLKYTGNNKKSELEEICENVLKLSGLWDEVKDRLKVSALALSGGQQQRLCIARTLAVSPDIILMDEPTSALDPISTSKIEESIFHLKQNYTLIIVTHNMQQAARVSDYTAYMYLGKLIELASTRKIFTSPSEKLTEEYITGKFG